MIDTVQDKLEPVAAGQAAAITAEAHIHTLCPDLTTVPVADVEPSRVVLAARRDDPERAGLVAAVRRYARARLSPRSPAG
ncbi:hypothetical protein ACWD4G_43715 [Streptomyces sp. NPDC002643]